MYFKFDRLLPHWIVAACLTGAGALGVIPLSSNAIAQQPIGGVPSIDQAPPPAFDPPTIDCLPRPCPPSVESCPPAGYPCYLESGSSSNAGILTDAKSWLFRRYAGSYEMKTKLPYPEGYRGNYYFRPWAPGYVRRTPDDFQPGVYDRPFYHHVDFYPQESYPTSLQNESIDPRTIQD